MNIQKEGDDRRSGESVVPAMLISEPHACSPAVTQKDAESMVLLCEEFLHMLFVAPAVAAELEADRKSR